MDIFIFILFMFCSFYVFSLKNDDFLYIAKEIVKLFPTEATEPRTTFRQFRKNYRELENL